MSGNLVSTVQLCVNERGRFDSDFYTVSNHSCNKYQEKLWRKYAIAHMSCIYCQAQDYFPWSAKNFIKVWWRFSIAHRKSVCNHDAQLFTICAGKSLNFWPKRENLFWKLAVRQPYVISENMRDAKRRENMELIHRECQINTICHLVIVCLAQVSASVPRDKNTNQTLGEMCTNNNVSKWKIWISYFAVARIPPFFICL